MEGGIFLLVFALIWIIFATIQDCKKREIADWLNFSLIIFALGFRFFYSLFLRGNFAFFYQGLIGLGIFLVLGNLLYYAKMFAGGDAKLMVALGAVLPTSENFVINLWTFVDFFILFFVFGALYGFFCIAYFAIKDYKNFKKEFFKKLREGRSFFFTIMFLGLLLMLLGFVEDLFFISGIIIFIFPIFYLAAKSVEGASMIRDVKVSSLTEGDWIYEDVKLGKKTIQATWEGLTKQDIGYIKKHSKGTRIKVKYGVPYAIVFLLSFLTLILFHLFYFNLWNSLG